MPLEMRNVDPSEIDAASVTLAKAFEDDPVKLFLCGGTELPLPKAKKFFAVFVKMQMSHGCVFTTPALEAVSIWAPPGHWRVPFGQIVKNTPTFVGLYGLRLFPNLLVLQDMEKRHPREPHYYLEFIGTAPEHQGKGAGTALVTPMIERCDGEGVGAYLESSKESNVPFYARFGFQVTEVLQHRRNGPKMWLMWRDPR